MSDSSFTLAVSSIDAKRSAALHQFFATPNIVFERYCAKKWREFAVITWLHIVYFGLTSEIAVSMSE